MNEEAQAESWSKLTLGARLIWLALILWLGLQVRGWIEGDAATYTAMAQMLARGSWAESGWFADLVKERYCDLATPVAGPLWNTAVLAGGDLVYTVAPGYPLWLALMKLIGGFPGLLFANLLLLLFWGFALQHLFFFEAKSTSWRDRAPLLLLALLIPLLLPKTFLQFTGHWREPLFLLLLTSAASACLAFEQNGGGLVALGVVAACMGAACSVKEANVIYAPVFAVWLAFSTPFRRAGSPQRLRWCGVALLAFLAGVAPLLLQNTLYTGLPWKSLHAARETAQYSMSQSGMGLSAGNIGDTWRNYGVLLGKSHLSSSFIWLLALAGLWPTLRRPLGRLLLGLGVVHLAVYLQWGRADLRHMYLLVLPVGLLLYHGVYFVTSIIVRGRADAARWLGSALWALLFVGLMMEPVRCLYPMVKQRDTVGRVNELLEQLICAAGGPDGLWMANKPLVQILAVGRGISSYRLQELYNVGDRSEWIARLRDYMLKGGRVFFVSADDRDPMHPAGVNWDARDRLDLLDHFDLRPLARLSVDEFERFRDGRSRELELFSVQPWSACETRRMLSVPDGGASFLWLPFRADAASSRVILQERELEPSCTGYYPVDIVEGSSNALFQWTSDRLGGVPQLEEARLIGKDERLRIDLGTDICPRDTKFWVAQDDDPQAAASYRCFNRPVTLRIPVFRDGDRFPVVGLVFQSGASRPARVGFQADDQPLRTVTVSRGQAWLPLSGPAVADGAFPVKLEALDKKPLPIDRIVIQPVSKSWSLGSEGEAGWIVSATLAPDHAEGEEPCVWSARTELGALESGSLPAGDVEVQTHFWTPPGAVRLEAVGVGFYAVKTTPLLRSMRVEVNHPLFDWATGLYKVERDCSGLFRWCHPETHIRLPEVEAARARFTLVASDTRPGPLRPVTLNWRGAQAVVQLTSEPSEHCVSLTAQQNAKDDGLTIVTDGWTPAKGGKGDRRLLGFRLYGLGWELTSAASTNDAIAIIR